MSEGKRMSNNKKVKSNTKKKNNMGLKVLGLIYAIITLIFYISVVSTNLIPGLYLVIFTIVEIALTAGIIRGIIKKRKNIKINVVCTIIAIIISVGYVFAINYINATMDFLEKTFNQVQETEEYYVIVRKDDEYTTISDIKGQALYVFKATEEIKKDITKNVSVEIKESESLSDMGNNLLKGEENAILVSSAQYSMLSEEIKDFKTKTKIIYTAKNKVKTSTGISKDGSKYTINDGIFNIYISGIDTRGDITNVARSDANMLVTVNTKTHEVLLTSIPRDYYVTLHKAKAKDKLTHSGIYGITETVTTVEDLLDTEINYYVRVNFTTVIKLVDKLGGIDVYSDYEFERDGFTFKEGYNHVNGEAALTFSRERLLFKTGDNQRIKNQQHVIEAIIKKVLDGTTILTKYTSILNALEGSFQTNIEQGEISNLIKDQLDNMSSWSIKNNSLVGTGATKTTYSTGSTLVYVMEPNEESVEKAKDKINSVLGN